MTEMSGVWNLILPIFDEFFHQKNKSASMNYLNKDTHKYTNW